tara:strand:- start:4284 stop:4526 length:243 start_codon:yes stop_codon:yes gene_type:complete
MNEEVHQTIKMMNTKEFSAIIENMVTTYGCSYMDAIVDYCQKENVEIETVAKLINTRIKNSIQIEAENLNFLPKTKRLPI